MKMTYAPVLVFSILAASAANAADRCKNEAIEPLVARLTQAWASKQLGSLDNERPYLGTIQFVVEHSSADHYEVEEKPNLEAIEQWLRSGEYKGYPMREARPLLWCKKGVCIFDFAAGIDHNRRYIQQITYEKKNGCVYIRSVFLLDGD